MADGGGGAGDPWLLVTEMAVMLRTPAIVPPYDGQWCAFGVSGPGPTGPVPAVTGCRGRVQVVCEAVVKVEGMWHIDTFVMEFEACGVPLRSVQ